ncbi:MAG: glycosyltransferase [bacterium]
MFNLINIPARFVHIPQIVTIHQSNLLAEIDYKMPLKDKIFFLINDLLFRFGKKGATSFAVQTKVMADNLAKRQKVKPDLIRIIQNGFEKSLTDLSDDELISAMFNSPNSIKALCIASYYPSKNLDIFIKVAQLVKQRKADIKIYVTVNENQHPWAARFMKQIKDNKLGNIIINLSYLSRQGVATAYRKADLFVLPTLLESFGIIYLEAMGFACPIATSDRDFARCVCGDAALYFDPKSPELILDTIIKIHKDKQLRGSLINNGRQRLNTFFKSWDEVAVEYLRLIESVL